MDTRTSNPRSRSRRTSGKAVPARGVGPALVAVSAGAALLAEGCAGDTATPAATPAATAPVTTATATVTAPLDTSAPPASVPPPATVTSVPPPVTVTAVPPTSTAIPPTSTAVPPTASPAPPGSPAPGSSPAGPAPCRTSDLRITVGGGSGGAAGSVYTAVLFTNAGSAPCTLDGHPGVSYVAGEAGTQVGPAAARTGTPSRVVLAPGAGAHATLRIVQYRNYPTGVCDPAAVRGFRVYPPDQTTAAFVPEPGTTCRDQRVLTVGPVAAGPPTE